MGWTTIDQYELNLVNVKEKISSGKSNMETATHVYSNYSVWKYLFMSRVKTPKRHK